MKTYLHQLVSASEGALVKPAVDVDARNLTRHLADVHWPASILQKREEARDTHFCSCTSVSTTLCSQLASDSNQAFTVGVESVIYVKATSRTSQVCRGPPAFVSVVGAALKLFCF